MVETMNPVVIVTGASRGIGKCIVESLVGKHAKVVGIATSEDLLKDIQAKYPENFSYVSGDITDGKVIDQLISHTVEKYGKIDSLVLNAGTLEPVTRVGNSKADDWLKLFKINFFSAVDLTSKSLPYLRKTKGRIIAVSSGASTGNYIAWGAYGSSKAALNHLMGTIKNEEAEHGIFTASVAPGVVDTRMQDDIRTKYGSEMGESQEKFIKLKNENELVSPEYVGNMYANLALHGEGDDINGKYTRYNDPKLAKYHN